MADFDLDKLEVNALLDLLLKAMQRCHCWHASTETADTRVTVTRERRNGPPFNAPHQETP